MTTHAAKGKVIDLKNMITKLKMGKLIYPASYTK